MTKPLDLPLFDVPDTIARESMPDLLRYWYLGTRARRHMMLRRFSEVDAELAPVPGARILDIGSAWGFNVMALDRLGFDAVGVDLVVDQFEVGRRIASHNDAEFRAIGATAAGLPFPDATFDAVTMVETFEHIFTQDRPAAVAECFRVLKPGGRVVLSTPNYASLVERVKRVIGRRRWLRDRLPTMCYPEEGTERAAYHPYRYHHPYPAAQISSLLKNGGFEAPSIKYFLFMLKNTSDAFYPVLACLERVFERTPGVRGLAATVCFTALKPPRRFS